MFFDGKLAFEVKKGDYVSEKEDRAFQHLTNWNTGLFWKVNT